MTSFELLSLNGCFILILITKWNFNSEQTHCLSKNYINMSLNLLSTALEYINKAPPNPNLHMGNLSATEIVVINSNILICLQLMSHT